MAAKSASKPKGRKGKIGKKKRQMAAYAAERRNEKSHARRIAKHLKRYGENDLIAVDALKRYKAAAGIRS